MRVALIYDREEGGLPVSTVTVAVSLARLGHSALLCGPPAPLPESLTQQLLQSKNIATFSMTGKKGVADFPGSLRKTVADFRADVIVTGHRGCDVRGSRLAQKLGLPHICVVGGNPSAEDMQSAGIPFLRLRNRAWQRALKEASRVVTVSEWTRRRAMETFPTLPPGKVEVVLNAVVPALADSCCESLDEKPHVPVRILAVGRLHHIKKPLLLPVLISQLKVSGLPAEARWVGSGEKEQALKEKVRECGVSEMVEIVSDTARIAHHYRWADLLVHFCTDEGFGLVLAEAQAAGLPVVAFNAGAVPEVVENDKTGLLMEACDIPAMSRSIVRLVSEKNGYLRISSAARKRANSLFSIERIGIEYERVLSEAILAGEKRKK